MGQYSRWYTRNHVKISCKLHNSDTELCEVRKSKFSVELAVSAVLFDSHTLHSLEYTIGHACPSTSVAGYLS